MAVVRAKMRQKRCARKVARKTPLPASALRRPECLDKAEISTANSSRQQQERSTSIQERMTQSRPTTQEQITSLWSLGGLSVVQLAKRVWRRIERDDVWGRASELAFNFFLAVFPLLLFLLSIFGILAGEGSRLRTELFASLQRALPPSAFEVTIKTLSEIIASASTGKTWFGALFFLWSATRGTTTMISALNAAYHVYDSRPWWKVRFIAVCLTICLCVLVVLALAVILFGGWVVDLLATKLGLAAAVVILGQAVAWIVALCAILLAFSLVYYFGPNIHERHWYWITPGSLTGVLLWHGCSIGLRFYLHFFNTYTRTYGSLGAVIILLLWFYATGLAFLTGAEVNAEIEHTAAEHRAS
jgi:membrane protein